MSQHELDMDIGGYMYCVRLPSSVDRVLDMYWLYTKNDDKLTPCVSYGMRYARKVIVSRRGAERVMSEVVRNAPGVRNGVTAKHS